ncbi:MAG: hypothetical protein NVSMB57_03250 [Actinomycetota bacterium]
MNRRLLAVPVLTSLLMLLMLVTPVVAFACGGLIAQRHGEVLRRATTLAAWTKGPGNTGTEHYITGFAFAGSADSFGYIIPLPAVPSSIVKGGDWTLERLDREVFPRKVLAFAGQTRALESVELLKHVKIDSLDVKVVRGGGRDVAAWAREHGFDLTKDTDAVLSSYKANIFALAKFDKVAAGRRFIEGQGVVIDFQIPLAAPWIPLRILSLGKVASEIVEAHLFLLTPQKPALYPQPSTLPGMHVVRDEWASDALINDLRSEKGGAWVPRKMWLTALELSAPAKSVHYDLSGLKPIKSLSFPAPFNGSAWPWTLIAGSLAVLAGGIALRTRSRDKVVLVPTPELVPPAR